MFNVQEIRTIIKFLHLSGYNDKEIHSVMSEKIAPEIVSLRTITTWTKRFANKEYSVEDRVRSGRPKEDKTRMMVELEIKTDKYLTCREIGRRLSIDHKTVSNILRNELKMKKINHKWIPHELTESQKQIRVVHAQNLQNHLSDSVKQNNTITLDETWVNWSNCYESVWLFENEKVPTNVKRSVKSKKTMITVAWMRNKILSITALPSSQTFTKKFFEDVVIVDILQALSKIGVDPNNEDVFVHMDNSPCHSSVITLKGFKLNRLVHPPYSPDLAPCDFFLFGYLKFLLQGKEFQNEKEVHEEVSKILTSIPSVMLVNAFEAWKRKLIACVRCGGDYV